MSISIMVGLSILLVASLIEYFILDKIRRGSEEVLKQKYSRLGATEFRCFKCKSLVQENDSKCPKCGWKWD